MAWWNNWNQKRDKPEHEDKPTDSLKNNPVASEFDQTMDDRLEDIINQNAVSRLDKDDNILPMDSTILINTIGDLRVAAISTNKIARIQQYQMMSKFPEVDWCIEEVADDFFHEDNNKKIIRFELTDKANKLDDKKKDILKAEFDRVISLFDLDENGFPTIKRYIIEGECCWENVIDIENPEKGIQAVRFIDNKYYDFLKDRDTGDIRGVYVDKTIMKYDLDTSVQSNSVYAAANVFNAINQVPNFAYASYLNELRVPLLWPQITYFNSGIYNTEKTIAYPILEKASSPYQQLMLLHDAAIILRVTRAPNRLMFNISTGDLPEKKAKQLVERYIQNFKSRKVANSKGEVKNSYNAESMLEAYFFWKKDGTEGSSVATLNQTASYDEMKDVEYFLRRIFKSFKVPFSRFKEAEGTLQRKDTITYEEYSFCRFIMRHQKMIASAFKRTYITHLKLRKIWEEYGLTENFIKVTFTPPGLFELYQMQALNSVKFGIYKEMVENDESFSKNLAMKKILGYTDKDIDENAKERRKEKLFEAVTEFFVDKLKAEGPSNYPSPIPYKGEIIRGKNKDSSEGGGDSGGMDDMGSGMGDLGGSSGGGGGGSGPLSEPDISSEPNASPESPETAAPEKPPASTSFGKDFAGKVASALPK